MKTITFYSYKGGTGRSLAVANAARYLARLNFKVVALDFDLEAPGLHYKFAQNAEGKPLSVEFGIVDYLHEFIREGSIPDALEKFVITLDVPGTTEPLLRLIPAGRGPSAEYWQKLSLIDWHELFYSPNAKGVQLFLDLKQRIADELQPDFLLIDSRTGITEMGGVAATLLADRVISLVLPSLENMEGARAVLRSIQRTRRDMGEHDVELILALSRLPSMKNSEEESTITDRIKDFFNAESENLEDTLSFQEVFVLHTEKSLELQESLLVGGEFSPDESVLLRDYLRLFANLGPQDLMLSQVEILAQQTKNRIWDDPEGALQEMEELAESFAHPDIYRTLFQFYKIRNIQGTTTTDLKKAQLFWLLSNDNQNSWVWHVIQNTFKPILRRVEKEEWSPDLDFISAVWQGIGAYDESVGRRLVQAYANKQQHSKVADTFLEILNHAEVPTIEIVKDCIVTLWRVKRNPDVEIIIDNYRYQFIETPEFIKAWARYALDEKNNVYLNELASEPLLNILQQSELELAIKVLETVGQVNKADALTLNLLKQTEISMNGELADIATLLKKLGKWDLFEGYARPFLEDTEWKILMNIVEDRY